MKTYVFILSLAAALSLATCASFAGQVVVETESFETAPAPGIDRIDGVQGKAGRFDGETSFRLKSRFRCTRVELSLSVCAKDVRTSGAAVPEWIPVFHSGGPWQAGAVQAVFRDGKFSVHFHNDGNNRVRLDTPPLENDRWYRIGFVLDADRHDASILLDGRTVETKPIDPEILYFEIDAPRIGTSGNRNFRGLMDEIELKMTTIPPHVSDDPRNIVQGYEIPREQYCDQPFVVVLRDGTWLCTMTTGRGLEGEKGQHVVATRSSDQGKTWGPLIDIEPAGDVAASWVVPLATDFGRIYAFYTYNGDRVHLGRDDTHGWYVYRYSDDGGLSWSDRRRIPLRKTACDRLEKDGKLVQMFWGICKPRVAGNDVFIPFTKLGKYFLEEGEGWVLHSDNILAERDPEKIRWELLPEGEHGIRHPEFGSVQEEHNLVPLDRDGSLLCVYRTTRGFPACSYSRDRGRSWSLPEPMVYATGRTIRHPRACPMVWKCGSGRYLFWCHNNGGTWFENRNPAWLCVGLERDGKVYWSQPEIAIYADEPSQRMSYPDLIQHDGRYWITETQKEVARVHVIDTDLLNGAWKRLQDELDGRASAPVRDGLRLETSGPKAAFPASMHDALSKKGLAFEFVVRVPEEGLKPETVLIDNRTGEGKGFVVATGENGTYTLEIVGDVPGPRNRIQWSSDTGLLTPGRHCVTIIIDAAPRLILSVCDGQSVDGNGERPFGWGRYLIPPNRLEGSGTLSVSPAVETLRLYDRPLKTFEATSNQSGP